MLNVRLKRDDGLNAKVDIFLNLVAADFEALPGPPVIESLSRACHPHAGVNAGVAPHR
jgi:hypothetical protein